MHPQMREVTITVATDLSFLGETDKDTGFLGASSEIFTVTVQEHNKIYVVCRCAYIQ